MGDYCLASSCYQKKGVPTTDNVIFNCREEVRNAVTVRECGLDLEGIPENEQTKEVFRVARMTGLSTVLSLEDAIKVARLTVPQKNLQREATRFMADARAVIQALRTPKK